MSIPLCTHNVSDVLFPKCSKCDIVIEHSVLPISSTATGGECIDDSLCNSEGASGDVLQFAIIPDETNCIEVASGPSVQSISCSVRGYETRPGHDLGHVQSEQWNSTVSCVQQSSQCIGNAKVDDYDCGDIDSDCTIDGSDVLSHITDISHTLYLDDEIGGDVVTGISMCPMDIRLKPRHSIGGFPSQLNLSTWDYYLSYEPDMDLQHYLHNGILHGFSIVDPGSSIPKYRSDNYKSVLSDEAYFFVNDLIMEEIKQGKYVRVDEEPHCTMP